VGVLLLLLLFFLLQINCYNWQW